jgi:excinuclease ABC subunit C
MLALDCRVVFDPERAEEILEALPPRPAVVLVEPRAELAGARPLLLRTADLRRRMRLLLGPPDAAAKRINLREYAEAVRFRFTGSAFEQALVHWQHARFLWPRDYRERMRLRPAPMVKLNLANAYPRAYITRRIGAAGVYFGPFASRRSAEAFLEPFLDLFRIRRCQIKIRRDPDFPGCIYSEMKMCLAPCFAGCSAEEYGVEVGRVLDFLRSRGGSLSGELSREREESSAQTDFERAASAHRRLEKADALLRLMPDLVRCVDALDAIILQRAAERSAIAVFVVRGGHIADPFLVRFAELASQPRSVEQILRDFVEPSASAGGEAGLAAAGTSRDFPAATELEDHLAVLGRWFYGRPRQGEIFFAEGKGANWPYRRILRACSRLLAPQGPEKDK